MTMRRLCFIFMFALATATTAFGSGPAHAAPNTPDHATGFLLNGRQLTPAGVQVAPGEFPTGGAVTADGRAGLAGFRRAPCRGRARSDPM